MLATDPDLKNQAIDRLVAEHLDQEALSRICSQLAQRPLSDASEVQLTAMIEKSPHDVVRATATMALASQVVLDPGGATGRGRIKDLYQSVIDHTVVVPDWLPRPMEPWPSFDSGLVKSRPRSR